MTTSKPFEAIVLRPLPNAMFLVELTDGREVAVHASGRMRVHLIRLVSGDKVTVEVSPFDTTKGRIIDRP